MKWGWSQYLRIVLLLLLTAAVIWLSMVARENTLRQRPMLPVYFDHRQHDAIACVDCHHNYTDDTGFESCYACHKFRPEIQREMEAQFHQLCKSCHIERHHAGEKAGPQRRCSGCHRPHPLPTGS